MIYVVIYQESHPDRAYEFLGVFSSEERATEAIQRDMETKQKLFP